MSPSDPGARYRAHWSKNENDDTISNDSSSIIASRQDRQAHYKEIARDYYDLTTNNYESGWGEHFHFCRFVKPGESIDTALCRSEHYLALMTGMKRGMKVLDAGCGVGEPAREMARFAGVSVIGVSINKMHVERATRYSKEDGFDHLVEFMEGDFMNLPFPDSTFDAVYSIEATCYAPDLRACYAELLRVLKPGGICGIYEWQMTSAFCADEAHHLKLRQRIERGNGITNLLAVPGGVNAMRSAGFEVMHHEDLAQRGDELPWWWCIDGDTSKAKNWRDWRLVFMLKKWVWRIVCKVAWLTEFVLRCSPKGSVESLWTQGMCTFALRDGGKEGLFKPMYMMIGRKPVSPSDKRPEAD